MVKSVAGNVFIAPLSNKTKDQGVIYALQKANELQAQIPATDYAYRLVFDTKHTGIGYALSDSYFQFLKNLGYVELQSKILYIIDEITSQVAKALTPLSNEITELKSDLLNIWQKIEVILQPIKEDIKDIKTKLGNFLTQSQIEDLIVNKFNIYTKDYNLKFQELENKINNIKLDTSSLGIDKEQFKNDAIQALLKYYIENNVVIDMVGVSNFEYFKTVLNYKNQQIAELINGNNLTMNININGVTI